MSHTASINTHRMRNDSGLFASEPVGRTIQPQGFRKPMIFTRTVDSRILGILPSRETTSIYRGLDGRVSVKDGKPVRGDSGPEVTICHVPSGRMATALVRTNDFATDYIPAINTVSKSDMNTGYTTDAWFAASDVSAVSRNIAWILNPQGIDSGFVGLSYTSAAGLITGPLQVVGAVDSLREAEKIGDVAGERIAAAQVARGGVDTVTGVVVGGMRTMSLVGLSSTAQTVVTAGMVLGFLATGLWSLSLGLQTVQFGVNAVQSFSVLQELNHALDTGTYDTALRLLLSKWELSADDFEGAKQVIEFTSPVDLYNRVVESIELTEGESGILTVAEKDSAQRVVNGIMKGLNRSQYSEIPDWDQVRDHLTVRYEKELARVKMVKEASYRREIGPDSLKMIKEGIREGGITSEQAKTIVDTAHDEARFKAIFNGFLLFAGVIGILSFIMTTIFTGGVPLLVGFIIMLVMNVALTSADVYSLFKDFDSVKKISTKDIVILVLFALVTLASVGVGAFFAGGPLFLGIILALGGLMLAIQAGTMAYAIHKHNAVPGPDETSPLLGGAPRSPVLPLGNA